jgi:alpha-D-xyloside xylohydrolase
MDFRSDPATYGIADQFMFGPSIMVCPVLDPMFHEPRREAEIIAADFLRTPEGTSGLAWSGFVDADSDVPVFAKHVDELNGSWAGGPPPGLPFADYKLRWDGEVLIDEAGDYEFLLYGNDGRRLWLDDELAIDGWNAQGMQTYTARRTLAAGTRLKLRVEYVHHHGSALISLSWRRPGPPPKSELVAPERAVYLPAGGDWYDFHSSTRFAGGNTITVPAPIERIPLFVRAGSILPLGPVVTHSAAQVGQPLEVVVYPGADAHFTLYDDAGDGYAYERGEFATIALHWDDAARVLTLRAREGAWPGMQPERRFEVRLAGSAQARTITYTGEETEVRLG